jgi:hypothetical protein
MIPALESAIREPRIPVIYGGECQLVIRFSAQGGLNAIRDGKNCINP